jgi:hypothetical protein
MFRTGASVSSKKSKVIPNKDVKLLLKKYGLIVHDESNNQLDIWNRLTLFQWFTQIFGWIYVIKGFTMSFLLEDQSEWKHYFGDFSPVISKSIE